VVGKEQGAVFPKLVKVTDPIEADLLARARLLSLEGWVHASNTAGSGLRSRDSCPLPHLEVECDQDAISYAQLLASESVPSSSTRA
jgi:hypothetical protein